MMENRQTVKNCLSTPIFTVKNIQKEFIDSLINTLPFEFTRQLTPAGVTTVCGIDCNRNEIHNIQSKSDHALVPYWERWYNGVKKHVPPDFILTPTVARYWFYGDGSSSAYKDGKKVNICFCTNSFTQKDCEHLCSMWETLGIHFYPAKTPTGPVLTLGIADDIRSFFDYMGEPELSCFSYKRKRPIP